VPPSFAQPHTTSVLHNFSFTVYYRAAMSAQQEQPPSLAHKSIAAAGASVVSALVVNPLDVVKVSTEGNWVGEGGSQSALVVASFLPPPLLPAAAACPSATASVEAHPPFTQAYPHLVADTHPGTGRDGSQPQAGRTVGDAARVSMGGAGQGRAGPAQPGCELAGAGRGTLESAEIDPC